jgi:hypothetical protein
MGADSTEKCFFSNKDVISWKEIDGSFFDGFYYRVEFNGNIREIRLSGYDDWEHDVWMKENGNTFFELLETNKSWNIFERGKKLEEIKQIFYNLQKQKNCENKKRTRA